MLFSPKSMNLVLALCPFCTALKLICSLSVKLAVCQECPNWLASVVYLQSAEGSVHKQAALEGQCPFLPETDISGLGKWGFLCSHKGLRKKKKSPLGQFQKEFSLGWTGEMLLCNSLLLREACMAWGLQAREETRPGLCLLGSLEGCCPGQDLPPGGSGPPSTHLLRQPPLFQTLITQQLCLTSVLPHQRASDTLVPSRNVHLVYTEFPAYFRVQPHAETCSCQGQLSSMFLYVVFHFC